MAVRAMTEARRSIADPRIASPTQRRHDRLEIFRKAIFSASDTNSLRFKKRISRIHGPSQHRQRERLSRRRASQPAGQPRSPNCVRRARAAGPPLRNAQRGLPAARPAAAGPWPVPGAPQASSFSGYGQLLMDESIPVEVHIVKSTEGPGGIGETATVSAPPPPAMRSSPPPASACGRFPSCRRLPPWAPEAPRFEARLRSVAAGSAQFRGRLTISPSCRRNGKAHATLSAQIIVVAGLSKDDHRHSAERGAQMATTDPPVRRHANRRRTTRSPQSRPSTIDRVMT